MNEARRRQAYALACVVAGALEHHAVLYVVALVAGVLLVRVPSAASTAATLSVGLAHVAAALWVRWRYLLPSPPQQHAQQ